MADDVNMADDEIGQRVANLEDKYTSLENVLFQDKGVIPQLQEIKACIVEVNMSLDTLNKSLHKIDEHDKLFEGFRQSLFDIMIIKKECSERIEKAMTTIHQTLYGNGSPLTGLVYNVSQIKTQISWTMRIGIIIIGILLIMLGFDKFLPFVK